MIDASQIRAITLDLDDTLWPVWPTIHRAEALLLQWLHTHAPATARIFAEPQDLRRLREAVGRSRPDLAHDLSAMRQETIRLALQQAGDDEALVMPAFEVFFAERHRVTLFDDALPALEFLAARWPVVAITNGNADVHRVGIGRFFRDSFNVLRTGVAKPDARIFAAAVQTLGVPAAQVLHVGDDALLDVVGAQRAGLAAVWLNRTGSDWPQPDMPAPWTVDSLQALCATLQG